jgi:hypothetical protein
MDNREEMLSELKESISTLNDNELEQLIDYALNLINQHIQ